MKDPTFIKVDGKPGVRPTVVEFMVDGYPILITANGSSLEIKASAEISVYWINRESITLSHKGSARTIASRFTERRENERNRY